VFLSNIFSIINLNPLLLFFSKVEYLIEDMKNYNFLLNKFVRIQDIDEVEEYNNAIKALHIIGMNQEEIICKFISEVQIN